MPHKDRLQIDSLSLLFQPTTKLEARSPVPRRRNLLAYSPPSYNSPSTSNSMLTPQQHEQSQKQSAADEKKARLHAESALRHHGFVPKWERRKRRVGGDIKKRCFGDEEGGGSSLPEALIRPQHDDEKLMKEAVQVPPESDMNTAADAATTAAQEASDAVAALSESVTKLIAGLQAQIKSLAAVVAKIAKKVKA